MPFDILFPDGFSALTKPATSLFTLYVSLNAFSGDHCEPSFSANPSFSSSGLTPRIPRTVYRYF